MFREDGHGLSLTLTNGAVWNVTETSYLTELTVDGGAVRGTVTVDGAPVDVSAGGSWSGEIVVAPAPAAAVSAEPAANASGEASNMPDGSMPPPPPADLAPGQEPPGGFGGID